MFDDLRRNFVMNPSNGLKIRPFRKAHMNRDSDRELFDLTKYLLEIATVEVFNVSTFYQFFVCRLLCFLSHTFSTSA